MHHQPPISRRRFVRNTGRAAGACLLGSLATARAAETGSDDISADVCVVGGGIGGCGAAIAAARAGARVILLERNAWLGGTNTAGYVAAWQAGPGDSLAREIYDRLRRMPGGPMAAVAREHNLGRKMGPFALWLIVSELSYEQTLRRSGRTIDQCAAVVFDPEVLNRVLADIVAEAGDCRLLRETNMVDVRASGRRITAVLAESSRGDRLTVRARVFIDSTGGVALCRKLGCETMLGAEPSGRFHEPSAPPEHEEAVNGISLCYRICRNDSPRRQPEPRLPVSRWSRTAHVTEIPGGDLMVNPMAIVPGMMLLEDGYDQTMTLARRTVEAHWHWLQGLEPFVHYELHSMAPMLGIRETHRVVGEYVLTENDVREGLKNQSHPDIVVLADHSIDMHCCLRGSRMAVLKEPYGVPYRCLIPKGWENLLVACRGASLSHIAASSCRLSRTILALGHAAGLAAAQAARRDLCVGQVDVAAIQSELGMIPSKPR